MNQRGRTHNTAAVSMADSTFRPPNPSHLGFLWGKTDYCDEGLSRVFRKVGENLTAGVSERMPVPGPTRAMAQVYGRRRAKCTVAGLNASCASLGPKCTVDVLYVHQKVFRDSVSKVFRHSVPKVFRHSVPKVFGDSVPKHFRRERTS